VGEIITMRLEGLKEKIVGRDKLSGIIIRLFKNTWRILGNSISLVALLISFFSYRATVKEKELTTKLAELEQFYDAAVALPDEISYFPLLMTSDYFNTSNQDHRKEFSTQNKIDKIKFVIKDSLNENNKSYEDFNREFNNLFEKEESIKEYVDLKYRYLVYMEMNRERAGFSYHDDTLLMDVKNELDKKAGEFNSLSINSKEYYRFLMSYYKEEKKSLQDKYKKLW
jgi:hypothetical protein